MLLTVRIDEQIIVGVTPGLVPGLSSFTFNGLDNKPDYRGFEIVISELDGRGIMKKGLDYSWNPITGEFLLLQLGDLLADQQYYNVHFQPYPTEISNPIVYYLIDASFFIRNINIPNTETNPILERVNLFIEKYEPECLLGLLGYNLYKAVKSEISNRVTDLIFGKEYLDLEENTVKWQGLIHDVNQSLIANYIYYYFQEASVSQTTGVATSVSKPEGGMSISPADKMINAWKFFSTEAEDLLYFLWINIETYPEFSSSQYYKARKFAKPVNMFGF